MAISGQRCPDALCPMAANVWCTLSSECHICCLSYQNEQMLPKKELAQLFYVKKAHVLRKLICSTITISMNFERMNLHLIDTVLHVIIFSCLFVMTFAFKPEQSSPINMNLQPCYNPTNIADFFHQIVIRPPAYTAPAHQNPIPSTKYNFYDYNYNHHQSSRNFAAVAAAQSWDDYYNYDQLMAVKNRNNFSSSSSSCSSNVQSNISPFSDFDAHHQHQQQQQNSENLWKSGQNFDDSPKNGNKFDAASTPQIKIESPNFAILNDIRDHSTLNKPNVETPFAWMKNTAKSQVFVAKSNILQEKMGQSKTRTKEKYRVVYTDFQKCELEKEFCFNQYIDKERKTALTQLLSLSDRQIKIWLEIQAIIFML
uniref:Homeobox domain-containing protein n=1 Tax=Romanomermis culicivorax TaxID=13658 RepID=A0A915IXD3_ROMCU